LRIRNKVARVVENLFRPALSSDPARIYFPVHVGCRARIDAAVSCLGGGGAAQLCRSRCLAPELPASAAMANLAEAIQGLVHHMRTEQQMIRDWVDSQADQQREIKKLLEVMVRENVNR